MVVVKRQRVDDVADNLMMSKDWVRQWWTGTRAAGWMPSAIVPCRKVAHGEADNLAKIVPTRPETATAMHY